jgi:RNA polymerase sigma factor (TIGR02999 family)
MRQSLPDVTALLAEWSSGNESVAEDLFPLVYDELRKLARAHLRRERRPDHTLQPTALVHEAYLRIVDQQRVRWQNRAHFFAIASRMMRRILVDHARARKAARRGGGVPAVTLDEARLASREPLDVIALDDALERLAELDPSGARVIELRYFGGLSIRDTAEVMGTSASTVKREWNTARAWLFRELRAT